jgi:hypothetical protein
MEEPGASGGQLRVTGALQPPGWPAAVARLANDLAAREALLGTALCLAIVTAAGIGAYLIFGPVAFLPGVHRPPGLIDQFGSSLKDTLAAPFARWDSAWYLTAAKQGYGQGAASAAFFPLYPLLVAGLGALGPGVLAAGVLVSVASLLIGLRFIWLLTREELGERYPGAPRLAVLATALFPTAFFLTAVYPEALLLALSTGAFWCARKGRWTRAGLLGGLGTAAHSLGPLLVVPLGLLYLREHRWRVRRDVLWLALVPAGYVAFMAYLGARGLDPLWPLYAHETWRRFFTDPATGGWEAIHAAFAGIQQIVSGQSAHVYWPAAVRYYSPMTAAADNLALFAFLLLGIAGMVGAFRRLPFPYGVYVGVVLLSVLCYPIAAQPLAGLSRYLAVLFPVQIVIACWLVRHRRLRLPVLALSALALTFYAGYFATWHWVA